MRCYPASAVVTALLVLSLVIVPSEPTAAERPAAAPKDIPAYLQDISVTVSADGGTGSGVVKTTRDGQVYVWTAAHVVSGLRKPRTVVDPKSGSSRTVVEFDDAKVMKKYVEEGRDVGQVELYAEVIKYSNANDGEDLALLRVRKKNFATEGVSFYLEKEPPAVGAELYHCGSLLGEFGSNSFVRGMVAQHGRLIKGKVYDQADLNAFPGSSGGGVFLKSDGRLVGLVVRGAQGGFTLLAPARRMAAWAKKAKVEWAVKDDVAPPTREELDALSVEDVLIGK